MLGYGSVLLRLLGFRPEAQTEVTDRYIREQLEPSLLGNDELRFLFSGRSRDDHGEMRQVVSVWETGTADEHDLASRLRRPFECERSDLVKARHIAVVPISFVRTTDLAEASILRVFRGRTHADALDTYLEEARARSEVKGAESRRARAVFMAARPPDEVMAISIWPDWDTVSEATGGNLQTPIATRHPEHLKSWEASHYEVIPMTVAGAVADTPVTTPVKMEATNT